jgi:hypothetical protein
LTTWKGLPIAVDGAGVPGFRQRPGSGDAASLAALILKAAGAEVPNKRLVGKPDQSTAAAMRWEAAAALTACRHLDAAPTA